MKLRKHLLLILFCPMLACADKMYFTSDVYSDYCHTVTRMFTQLLHNGSYRTVGNIHVEEVNQRGGNRNIILRVNGRVRLNYSFSPARRFSSPPEDKVAMDMVNLLIRDKKAIRTDSN